MLIAQKQMDKYLKQEEYLRENIADLKYHNIMMIGEVQAEKHK